MAQLGGRWHSWWRSGILGKSAREFGLVSRRVDIFLKEAVGSRRRHNIKHLRSEELTGTCTARRADLHTFSAKIKAVVSLKFAENV